ncbi:YidC/Oxa1 family membrane protein insertase [Patescibacteria group bacterium]|nr:YidC/Oxa1 family membrane protein insertase [Patescibacteria group bacterium]MCL5010185.1 YidC/Oxa1 family membrane protein insertase [Patescibacteria group bacterium]
MQNIPSYAIPAINILLFIYKGLFLLHVPYALGFSIIILTVLIRFILYPLTAAQLRSSKKMQVLAPHLSKLKEKHGKDAKKLQAETMRLYKEHGVNPAAGCLPMLVQLPVIWTLYAALQSIPTLTPETTGKLVYFSFLKLQSPWDLRFFGLPLDKNPSHLISLTPLIILVPALTAFLQLIQSKMLFASPPKPKELIEDIEKKKEQDFATAFQQQSLYIFPAMIGFFSYSFPLGLSLYWNTFTIFGILQQYKIQGLGGLSEWKKKLDETISPKSSKK